MIGTQPAYETILHILKARTGLYFPPQRRQEAELGLRRAMARAGFADLGRFADLVAGDDRALEDLVIELAVTESYFFREPRQFEMIRNELLPDIRRRLGSEHRIRAWSAGCAAGEEPYSLAIVLEQEGWADGAHLLATDISHRALRQARSGVYNAWSVREGGVALSRDRLKPRDGQYVLDERLRRLVTFQYLNLAIDLYPSEMTGTTRMDLILCRNVLIYFDRATVKTVARRLFDCLAPGGWLIAASTDPPLGRFAPYEIVTTSAGIVYRRPAREAIRVRRPREEPALAVAAPGGRGESPARQRRAPTPMEPKKPKEPMEPPPPSWARDGLKAAQRAYAAGDYLRAAELARRNCSEPAGCLLRIRSLANINPWEAERCCAEALVRHPLSVALHYLRGVLLVGLGRDDEALGEFRQVTYLDRSQPLAQFMLGSVLQRRGDLPGARRAYRHVQRLCAALPPEESVGLSDSERADRLAEAAAERMAGLEAFQEASA